MSFTALADRLGEDLVRYPLSRVLNELVPRDREGRIIPGGWCAPRIGSPYAKLANAYIAGAPAALIVKAELVLTKLAQNRRNALHLVGEIERLNQALSEWSDSTPVLGELAITIVVAVLRRQVQAAPRPRACRHTERGPPSPSLTASPILRTGPPISHSCEAMMARALCISDHTRFRGALPIVI